MPSHLSSIGFPVSSQEDFLRLSARAARNGEFIKADGGSFRRWNIGGGPQLWVQLNEDDKIVGFDPHFAGGARMRLRLTRQVKQPRDHVLEGAFYAWAEPWNHGPYGDVCLVFHSPDFGLYRDLELPANRDVQIAAFAHHLEAFESEEAFRQSKWSRHAIESCISSGTFSDPPQSKAIFTGRVLRTMRLTNQMTGLSFHWARVRTSGGEVDIVADPEAIEGTLVTGGLFGGSFWLSGQIITGSEDRVVEQSVANSVQAANVRTV